MRAVAALVLAFAVAGCSCRAARPCADLKSLSLGDATITKAQDVPAGAFTVPAEPGARPESVTLPAFCRVQGVIAPTNDSHIEFEVWLPASAESSGAPGSGWNGKYQGVGNGAFAGSIEYVGEGGSLASALKAGYAASSTDTGHHADWHRRSLGARTSREGRRLRLSRHSRNGGEGQGHHPRLLWRTREAFVFQQLFQRRPSGPDGSTAISRRLTMASSRARRQRTSHASSRGSPGTCSRPRSIPQATSPSGNPRRSRPRSLQRATREMG